jgi:hypothetical protein
VVEPGVAISTWGLLFTINPILIGLTQYPVARSAGMRSPRAMVSLGILVEGVAMMLLWPFEGIAIVVGAILLRPHLRGSYEGVVNIAFAAMWAPGVSGGLWLVGIGHGELMLALCLPLAVLGALCFLPLPGEPVPVEESLPAPPEAAATAP